MGLANENWNYYFGSFFIPPHPKPHHQNWLGKFSTFSICVHRSFELICKLDETLKKLAEKFFVFVTELFGFEFCHFE